MLSLFQICFKFFEPLNQGDEDMPKKMWYSLMAVLMIVVVVLSACKPAAETPVVTEPPAAAKAVEVFFLVDGRR
jgi:hypothetical protein